MSKAYDIAVVGATGLIGETLIQLLEERGFPVGKLYALAGERSLESTLKFRGELLPVLPLEDFDFETTQIAFFVAGAQVATAFGPKAVGCSSSR